MRNVHKRNPGPNCLTTAEAAAKASGTLNAGSWTADIPPACVGQVRDRIYEDQQGLCCYCGVRLTAWSVEHHQARKHHPELSLAWRNLLGVCRGKTSGEDHCDKARGHAPLTTSPLDERDLGAVFVVHLTGIKRGEMFAAGTGVAQAAAAADIKTLNLNHPTLVANRRTALVKLGAELSRNDSAGRIKALYAAYTRGTELDDYAHILAAYLRLKAAQQKLSLT